MAGLESDIPYIAICTEYCPLDIDDKEERNNSFLNGRNGNRIFSSYEDSLFKHNARKVLILNE